MPEFDIDNPFKHFYSSSLPRCAPDAVNESHLALQAAIQVLADKGQVYVWTLEEAGDGVSGVYASLRGAIEGAVSITVDELLLSGEIPKNPAERRRLSDYLAQDVRWEFSRDPSVAAFLGVWIKTIDGAGTERHWTISWQELLP